MDDKPQSWKRLAAFGAFASLVVVAALVATVYIFADTLVKPILLDRLRSALAARVTIEHIGMDGLALEARGISISSPELTASAPRARARLLSWSGVALELEEPVVTLIQAGGGEAGTAEGSFVFDVKGASLEYIVDGTVLRAANVNGRFSLGEKQSADLEGILRLSEGGPELNARLMLEETGDGSHFEISAGRYAAGAFSMERASARGSIGRSGVAIDHFEVISPTGASGEDLWRSARASGSLTLESSARGWRYSLAARIDSAEALVGVNALSLGDSAIAFAANGSYERGRLVIDEASATAPQLLRLDFSGEIGPVRSRLEIEAALPGGALIQRIWPAVRVTRLEGAREPEIGVYAVIELGEALSLSGHALVSGSRFESGDLRIDIVSARLPLWLGPRSREPSPAVGWARIQAAAGFGVSMARTDLAFRSMRDGLRFERSVELGYAGGDVVLKDVLLTFGGSPPQLTAALSGSGIAAPGLGARFSLSTTISVRSDEISASGMMVRSALGDARFDRALIADPFGYPRIEADLSMSGVDLGRLSDGLAIGRINGILDGRVRELVIEDGMPVAFRATLRTRESGERSISVAAINNLSVISQGAVMSTLSQGIYRFIDFYRYKSIGIDARLGGNVFELRGTALPGSSRYLVYGGLLPPKIDIIAPEGSIPFSQLVERLGRVTRAGDPTLEVR